MTNPPTILSTSLFFISFGCSLSCLEDCFAVISTDCMQIAFPSTISLTVTVRVYIVHAMVSKAIWLKNNSSGRTGHQETSTSTIHCHMRHISHLIWCDDNSPTIHSLHFEKNPFNYLDSALQSQAPINPPWPGNAILWTTRCHKKCQELQQIEEPKNIVQQWEQNCVRLKFARTFCHLLIPFTQAFSFCSRFSVCPFCFPHFFSEAGDVCVVRLSGIFGEGIAPGRVQTSKQVNFHWSLD